MAALLIALGVGAAGALRGKDASVVEEPAQVSRASSSEPVAEGDLVGKVVRVSDGDTIVVLDGSKRQTKIRMLGIDAPEKSQPFGNTCRESLAAKIAGKQVRVRSSGSDRYGRTIGKILLEGRDVNLAQVEEGCAWHYKQFARNQPSEDRALYAAKETEARSARKGLWKESTPEAPWSFRQDRSRAGN